jgi:hypothetical protein
MVPVDYPVQNVTGLTSVESCNKTLHIQAGNDPIELIGKIPLLPYPDLYTVFYAIMGYKL